MGKLIIESPHLARPFRGSAPPLVVPRAAGPGPGPGQRRGGIRGDP